MTADLPEHGYSPVPSYEPGPPPAERPASAAADATTGGGLSASFGRGLTLEMVGILFSIASTVTFCLYVLQIQSFTRR